MLADKFIPVVLFVDDRRELEEIQTSFRNGYVQKIRTIRHLNADYQIRKIKMISQPLLVILDHNGEQVISQMGYNKNFNKYNHFLKDGFKMYDELQSE